jgi:hypothetical protein
MRSPRGPPWRGADRRQHLPLLGARGDFLRERHDGADFLQISAS